MINTKDILNSEKYIFRESPFKLLMQKRIIKILLVCSNYDAFMLEEDGRIEEQLFEEYSSLNLRYPPYFVHCDTETKAFELLKKGSFDMVITLFNTKGIDVFSLSENIKKHFPDILITALAPFSKDNVIRYEKLGNTNIDYIFSWMGSMQVLLAIIKLAEDKLNVENDVANVGVQVIVLVEDSVRFYSSYASLIYNIMYTQTKAFRNEGLNTHKRNMLMRGRPKVLLATNYEDAAKHIKTYKNNLLGVITDISFPKNGTQQIDAGLEIADYTRKLAPGTPVLLQSMDSSNEAKAIGAGIRFISKTAIDLPLQIKEYFSECLAFGDFEFRTHDGGEVVAQASNLKEFQERIETVSEHSLTYHSRRQNFSRWLKARAQFQLAEILAPISPEDFPDTEIFRKFVSNVITLYRLQINRSGISHFHAGTYDQFSHFTRAGEGSMGGKARGLAFADTLIHRYGLSDRYKNTLVSTPRSLVLCSSFFDQFMKQNNLYAIAFHGTDDEVTNAFSAATLQAELQQTIKRFVRFSKRPIAVRSSSVLEDSHYCSFAGIYHTQMVYNDGTKRETIEQLIASAIKSVYASVFLQSSKQFFKATANMLDEEKMSIVLQEVCGTFSNEQYYPHISGTAASRNFYPIPPENVSDGVCNIAIGLGSHIAGGASSVRFSPAYPQKAPHLSSTQSALQNNQRKADIIAPCDEQHFLSTGLKTVPVKLLTEDSNIKKLCSIYDIENNILRDSTIHDGRRITTFSSILQHGQFPLPEIVSDILTIAEKNLNTPVEIEFAVLLSTSKNIPAQFQLLQLRPMPSVYSKKNFSITGDTVARSILHSKKSMGNGHITGISKILYISEKGFTGTPSETLTQIIRKKNEVYLNNSTKYILIGPGRWGTSDKSLGIPIQWTDICGTSAIFECKLSSKLSDKSNGSHFFHNMVNFGIHYLPIEVLNEKTLFAQSFAVDEVETGIFELSGNFEVLSDGEKSVGVLLGMELA